MKRFIITLFAIVFTQSICYALEEHVTDSAAVEYQSYGNDTIYRIKYTPTSVSTFCGLKHYEENLFRKLHKQYNQIDLEYLIDVFNSDDENRVAFLKYVLKNVLEGYGKERCAELMAKCKDNFHCIQVIICIDVEGRILDLDFMYPEYCAEFMTNEDIVRNTQVLKDSEPFLFFEDYAEMGVKILPRFPIPIHERGIKEYLNEE
jgi:hypothetical protein